MARPWYKQWHVVAESEAVAATSTGTSSNSTSTQGSNDVQKQNALRKSLITGSAVLVEMLTGGLFLENVKMEKQRTSDPYLRICRRVLSQGFSGFWAGFWPWGFTLGLTKGIVLGGSRAFFLNVMLGSGMPESTADIGSGFLAGATQGVFMSPIMLARTRVNQHLIERASQSGSGKIESGLMQEMRISMSILNADISKQGMSCLLTGMPTMIFKRSIDWGSRFVLMRYVREFFYSRKELNEDGSRPALNNLEKLGSAIIGGGMSVFICMPVDRLMPILQAAGASNNQSARQILAAKMQTEGVSTLFRGFNMRFIHCSWHTTFAIFIADRMYNVIDRIV